MSTPAPRQRTVDEVAAPYANFLVRVPSAGKDVCRVCHSNVSGYDICYQCNSARRALGDLSADVTAFVSMAPRNEQLAHELFAYKRATTHPSIARQMSTGLAAVMWKWLGMHEGCILRNAGIPSFDAITSVPSTSSRPGVHPLQILVAGIVAGTEKRYEEMLTQNRLDLEPREQAIDRFRAVQKLDGVNVLAIDDTWTTGAHAQSASAALKAAGARTVGVLTIGRWFNPDFSTGGIRGSEWLARHRKPGWNWEHCCLE